MTKVHQLKKNTATLNREFDERFKETEGLYKLPFFGTNQDILLLGFYFSYLFLMIVMLVVYYKIHSRGKILYTEQLAHSLHL